jgi:hypothetical protein
VQRGLVHAEPFAVLPPGLVSTVPVLALPMEPKSLADTWAMLHFWLTASHAASLTFAPTPGPVTSRHLPPFRSVLSL